MTFEKKYLFIVTLMTGHKITMKQNILTNLLQSFKKKCERGRIYMNENYMLQLKRNGSEMLNK